MAGFKTSELICDPLILDRELHRFFCKMIRTQFSQIKYFIIIQVLYVNSNLPYDVACIAMFWD